MEWSERGINHTLQVDVVNKVKFAGPPCYFGITVKKLLKEMYSQQIL